MQKVCEGVFIIFGFSLSGFATGIKAPQTPVGPGRYGWRDNDRMCDFQSKEQGYLYEAGCNNRKFIDQFSKSQTDTTVLIQQ